MSFAVQAISRFPRLSLYPWIVDLGAENQIEHYLRDPSHRGDPGEGAFTGASGGAACGDLVRLSLETSSTGEIRRVTAEAEGCAAIRASAACLAGMVDGSGLLDAARITPDDLDAELGGLSAVSRHAAVLAVDALHRAITVAASSGATIATAAPDRVCVAVSGGVDSAVAALMQRDAGLEPVGITVKLWADPETDGARACCSPEAVLSARAVTHSLGLAHITLDLEEQFRSSVVAGFVEGYRTGKTPNPCILCNGSVRIDAMSDLAERIGADRLVTGHYADLVHDGEGVLVAEASDPKKDQSYMLAAIAPERLERLDFPLARTTKVRVREIAEENGLSVARKPESQDLCFLAGTGKEAFLARHGGIGDREGDVVDAGGKVLGRHRGHHQFTVGQRRGLGVATGEPRYVTGIDAATNTVTIGDLDELTVERVGLARVTLHRDGSTVDRIRLRYRSDPVPAKVDAPVGIHDRVDVVLGHGFAGAAPGQTAVLMRGKAVVGHGTIE
jgi:tRNA-specific 2-thiouridylase